MAAGGNTETFAGGVEGFVGSANCTGILPLAVGSGSSRRTGGAALHAVITIGEKLFISPKTVDTYRSRVMEKLGLTHRSELVRFALETGLLKSTREPAPPSTRG
jgi:hypothetical protein